MVGFDFISLSPYQNKEEGRKAHRTFLDPDGENQPVLIIEDMDLEGDLSFMKQVWVAPWLIKGVDSAPCTVLGLVWDEKIAENWEKKETITINNENSN